MWKDFFYYTKSERRAVYVLLVLIALLVVAIWVTPVPEVSLVADVSKVDSVELKNFEADIRTSRKTAYSKPRSAKQPGTKPVLSPFNPNSADSIELVRLGLPSWVASNVLKYRQKGGTFPTAESFARIYGLTEEKFNELKPYIRIPETPKKRLSKVDSVFPIVREEKPRAYKYPEGTLVDVNQADTAELKKIPGIGSGIAGAIVSYRNRLGGFYSLEQLLEIEYVTPSLMKWFKLETPLLRPLQVNEVGLDKLRAHPYLNFYQAKVIVEHRRKKGEIKSLSQLSLYEEFTEKDLERLSAYLKFD